MKNTYFQNGKETFLNINKELYRIFDEADLVNVEFLTNEWRKLNISNIKDASLMTFDEFEDEDLNLSKKLVNTNQLLLED